MSTTDSIQQFFTPEIIKVLNKLHRAPRWADDKAKANTDKSLMTAKVQKYMVEVGTHIVEKVPTEQHSQAWDYVAVRSASKLNSQVLQQLYLDIMAQTAAPKE
jgi:predicted RNase H-like nuclease